MITDALAVGVPFRASQPSTFTIVPAGTNVLLKWPASPGGFSLQTATNLAAPIWINNPSVPVVASGQNTVTNHNTSPQSFFRLRFQ